MSFAPPVLGVTPVAREPDPTRGADDRFAELQLKNSRLRRLVIDLLLEKIKVVEAAQKSLHEGTNEHSGK